MCVCVRVCLCVHVCVCVRVCVCNPVAAVPYQLVTATISVSLLKLHVYANKNSTPSIVKHFRTTGIATATLICKEVLLLNVQLPVLCSPHQFSS